MKPDADDTYKEIEEVQREIERQLRRGEAAVADKNLREIASVYHPQFVEINEDEQEASLEDLLRYERTILRVTTWINERIRIRDFSFDGERASLVEESQRRSQSVLSRLGLLPSLVGGVSVIVRRYRTTWEKTPQGWQRRSARLLGWYTSMEPVPPETARRAQVVSASLGFLGAALALVWWSRSRMR